jgi:hypothetical protein
MPRNDKVLNEIANIFFIKFFVYLKIDLTSIKLALLSPYLNIENINSYHNGIILILLWVVGITVSKYMIFNLVFSSKDDLLFIRIS